MRAEELLELFQDGVKRYLVLGDQDAGVIIGLDIEGRAYTVLNGDVVNIVNPKAIREVTTRSEYLNPGGDGLWPAPEGTRLGYEYSTGAWRVPPGLTGARYDVVESAANRAVVEAEVDLINASGLGVPAIFRRDVSVDSSEAVIKVRTVESIEYIGSKSLSKNECLLVPWTLCQFSCEPGCEVVFPETDTSEVWDMYDPSDSHRRIEDGLWSVNTDGSLRYQIGISPATPWLELRLPEKGLKVRRTAAPLDTGFDYIDIVDADPSESPSDNKVRYSVYCDTTGFLEIEAAGGAPEILNPGTVSSLEVVNVFEKL